MLCTDDSHPHTIVSPTAMDRVLREAVSRLDPASPPMCTITCATHGAGARHGLSRLRADIVLFEDLKDSHVIIDGDLVAQDGKTLFKVEPFAWPDFMTHTRTSGSTSRPIPSASPSTSRKATARYAPSASPGDHADVRRWRSLRDGSLQADPTHDVLKA